jgi:hypothetical protein
MTSAGRIKVKGLLSVKLEHNIYSRNCAEAKVQILLLLSSSILIALASLSN